MSTIELLAGPTIQPVSLAEARLQVRQDDGVTVEDGLLSRAIVAATRMAEHSIGRSIIDRSWLLTLDAFASSVDLCKRGVREITSVTYDDLLGVDNLMAADDYRIEYGHTFDVLAPVVSWPSGAFNIRIEFVQGYGPAEDDAPAEVRNWILLQVATFMRNREAFAAGVSVEELPNRWADSLLDPERNYTLA